jgi:hypothetical protein
MTPKKNYQNIKEADVGEEEKRERDRERGERERARETTIVQYWVMCFYHVLTESELLITINASKSIGSSM